MCTEGRQAIPRSSVPEKPPDKATMEAKATCGRGRLEVLCAKDSAGKQHEDLMPEEEESFSSVFCLIQGQVWMV